MFLSSNHSKIEGLVIHSLEKDDSICNLKLSSQPAIFNLETESTLLKLFTNNYKVPEFFSFDHSSGQLELNPMWVYVNGIFEDQNKLFENSKLISKLLSECSSHPKIKGGDILIAYIKDVVIDDEIVDAIGILKNESKNPFVIPEGNVCRVEEGIDIDKIDKGCLICNVTPQKGYKILNVDKSNIYKEAQYWRENFLRIIPVSNDYTQTTQYIQATKSFLKNVLHSGDLLDTTEQVGIMKRSEHYFKNNTQFSEDAYSVNVFKNEHVADAFKTYKKEYEEEKSTTLFDNFDISDQAVKRQSRVFKSIIKLDKNFHIYVHGDRNKIMKGEDDNGNKYYILYYDNEN
ncbi:MAG: nucleoid-associated protein [Saprospiraceae bacterium]